MKLHFIKMGLGIFTLIIGMTYGDLHLSAGGHAGNGGDCVIIDEIPYLLDLVEAGIHTDPYFANRNDFYPKLRDRIMTHVDVEESVANLIAAKIKEIDTAAPFFGYLIKLSLFSLYWTFLDQELMDIDDHGDTVMEYRKLELVQMAVRKGFDVTINRTIWKKAPETNRAALILHECVYAIAPHIETSVVVDGTVVKTIQQQGLGARAITGWLFRENFISELDTNRLIIFLSNHGYCLNNDSNSSDTIASARILKSNNRLGYTVWSGHVAFIDIFSDFLILPDKRAEDQILLVKISAPFWGTKNLPFDAVLGDISVPYSFEWLP